MSNYKRLNIISDRSGVFVSVIRSGKPARRYRHLSAASLMRCKCIIRKQLGKAN